MTGVAALAGTWALALSFAALFVRRIASLLRVCVMQALGASLVAAAQGWARNAALLYLVAVLALALNGLALPIAVRRMIDRTTMPASIGLRCGLAGSATAAFALVAASSAAVTPQTTGVDPDLLTMGVSVLLLGLLLLAARSHHLLPALGLLSSQNGLVLAGCAIPGLPPPVLILAVVPLVPSLVVMNSWLHDRNRPAAAPPWA
jgi:hydrogenase-4 membrane subunit HyfE